MSTRPEAEAAPLPGVLAALEELVGRDLVVLLAAELGGDSVHVPHPENLHPEHPLYATIGSAARAIAERYAGEALYIPRARAALVADLSARGLDTRAIASRLGISRRAVRWHRRAAQRKYFP